MRVRKDIQGLLDTLFKMGYTFIDKPKYKMTILKGPLFYIRISWGNTTIPPVTKRMNPWHKSIVNSYRELYEPVRVELAEKITFDRWANSVNFVVSENSRLITDEHNYFADAIRQAQKICRAMVFDFNSYFYDITL